MKNLLIHIPVFILSAIAIAVASFSTLCIVQPERVSAYARRRYFGSSKFMQKLPFSNMVMKPWYPAYIRIMGIVGWGYALICFYGIAARF